jgi:cation transport ATPase
MNRIFAPLASFAVLFLLATLALGLFLRTGDIRNPSDLASQSWATWHRQAGVAAGLFVVLVNSIVVTYFVGTTRWCREVVETYSLDVEFIRRGNRLKHSTFPLALLSILAIVGLVALGGAADPAARLKLTQLGGLTWTNIHFAAACLVICFVAYASFIESYNIRENHRVISEVMGEVARIRKERGLD